VTAHHGQLRALDNVSLTVMPGDVYAIIGANGAGKSTLMRAIPGLHRPTVGSVLLDGADVTGQRAERRLAAGIAMVPEGRRLFPTLTVQENLLVGAAYARQGRWTVERVYELFGWMRDRRRQKAAQLSGGEQQAVAIGRALVATPGCCCSTSCRWDWRRWSSGGSTPCSPNCWRPASRCCWSGRT
jgi:branched-chain amino acid transport system ATP-binding protein